MDFDPLGRMAKDSLRIANQNRSIRVAQTITAIAKESSQIIYGPVEIISRIALEDATGLPAAGSVPTTLPEGTLAS